LQLREFQTLIEKIYFKKDKNRGVDGTFRWFTEETGELARAIRMGGTESLKTEFADSLAWLLSLSTLCGIDMEEAMAKYLEGCPKCHQTPCECLEINAGNAVIAGCAGDAENAGIAGTAGG
jgi:NTP pyrophosphatase (non-canonical NTP hydrolase)